MGQYFKPVNLDRREYVCPWCLNGGANLWEWAASPQGAILILLLRKSDKRGGGDVGCPPIVHDAAKSSTPLNAAVAWALFREGSPAELPPDSTIGSWAEDRVALIGDYDS